MLHNLPIQSYVWVKKTYCNVEVDALNTKFYLRKQRNGKKFKWTMSAYHLNPWLDHPVSVSRKKIDHPVFWFQGSYSYWHRSCTYMREKNHIISDAWDTTPFTRWDKFQKIWWQIKIRAFIKFLKIFHISVSFW